VNYRIIVLVCNLFLPFIVSIFDFVIFSLAFLSTDRFVNLCCVPTAWLRRFHSTIIMHVFEIYAAFTFVVYLFYFEYLFYFMSFHAYYDNFYFSEICYEVSRTSCVVWPRTALDETS